VETPATTISCRFVASATLFLLLVFTVAATPASPQELPPGIRWSVAIAAAPSSMPTVSGDRVFVATLPGVVTVHDIKDGREVWREPINAEQPIVVEGPHVFIASAEAVHALQVADRAVAWRTSTGMITAPLVVKEGWVVAASETRMLALRASDGSVVWQRETALQRERAAIDGNTLFVPLANGRLQAVDLANGALRWERPLGGSPAEPLVVGDRLYVGATDKRFYCVNTSNGDIKWTIKVGSSIRGRASTDGERVFYAGLDNLIRAISRGSGSQRWQRGIPFRPFAGPLVAGGSVFVAGPINEVRMLSVVTGAETGKITFPEPLVTAPAVGRASGGEVVVAAVTGGLNESWKLSLASPVAPKPSATPQQRPPVLRARQPPAARRLP
jgi:outer membrane protein assembly factor BamB